MLTELVQACLSRVMTLCSCTCGGVDSELAVNLALRLVGLRLRKGNRRLGVLGPGVRFSGLRPVVRRLCV